ncbi:MAG TPA: hypothetical protein VNY05_27475 [Candidatus Acidoferrales bacterium]|nr:hypothetical protein [Candidatus Acidoferrales bacterium]
MLDLDLANLPVSVFSHPWVEETGRRKRLTMPQPRKWWPLSCGQNVVETVRICGTSVTGLPMKSGSPAACTTVVHPEFLLAFRPENPILIVKRVLYKGVGTHATCASEHQIFH